MLQIFEGLHLQVSVVFTRKKTEKLKELKKTPLKKSLSVVNNSIRHSFKDRKQTFVKGFFTG